LASDQGHPVRTLHATCRISTAALVDVRNRFAGELLDVEAVRGRARVEQWQRMVSATG
jgi:hypothetical protein